MTTTDSVEAFLARYHAALAEYQDDDGEVRPADYPKYDECRADWGEDALDLLERIADDNARVAKAIGRLQSIAGPDGFGWEWDGIGWMLNGSGADHASVLYEVLSDLGLMREAIDAEELTRGDKLLIVAPDDPDVDGLEVTFSSIVGGTDGAEVCVGGDLIELVERRHLAYDDGGGFTVPTHYLVRRPKGA